MNRIGLGDNIISAIMKMADGNPGAVNVLGEMVNIGPKIDPQNFAGPFSGPLGLDAIGVYGSSIWIFFKDICKGQYLTMFALLRAQQLGIIPHDTINTAINHRITGGEASMIDAEKIITQVREKLTEFGAPDVVDECNCTTKCTKCSCRGE